MPIKFSINLTTIILIIVIIALGCLFLIFYTPRLRQTESKLRQAEKRYMELKDSMEKRNKELEDNIKELEKYKKEIHEKLSAEKERSARLEKEIEKEKIAFANALSKIKKMTDDEIVIKTRTYLNESAGEITSEETEKILEKDIFKTQTNVIWSFKAMKTNFSVLTEHKYLKFNLKPQLEEKCSSLEKQRDYYSGLYNTQLGITEKRTEMFENEKILRKECESIYNVCKKQLRSGKTKSFLLGSGIGAVVVIIITSVKCTF